MAHPHRDLFGLGIYKDGTVWWYTQLPVHVHHNMALKIRSFLYYATEYTLFTKIWKSDGSVDEEIQGGTKRAIELTSVHESALIKFNEKVLNLDCTLNDLHDLEKPEKSGGIGMKIVIKNFLGNEIWDSVSSVCYIDLECERAFASACTKTKEGKINIDNKKIAEALILFIARKLPKATRELIDISACMEGEYSSTVLIPSQELKAEYNELEKFLGVESIVWNVPIDPPPKYIYIDLHGAYLDCEDSEWSISEALPWKGWIPTPLIDYLLSAGWLISITPREIIYSVGKKSCIEFPPDRDIAVYFMESYARNAQ
ncbi:607_t:CDS:2, partial [Ambispora leptoticha]